MNRMWMCRVVITTVILGSALTAAAGDLTIVSKVTPAKGDAYTSTQYLTPERMRISDGETDTIVDLKDGKIVQIDHTKKTYFETTFAEMQQHFAELAQMLESNPMMQSMMGKVTDVSVQKTASTREIAGYSCTDYRITLGSSFSETVCVTPDIDVPMEYYDASKMMYAMMGPMASRFEKLLDEMKKLEGFAVATDLDMKVMGMDASSSSEVTEVREGSVPDEVFAVPAGYKKKKAPFED